MWADLGKNKKNRLRKGKRVRHIQGVRDLWSLEVQRDPIKWAKKCEDIAHKKRAGDREDWKSEQSQIEDRLVCRKWRAARWEEEGEEGKKSTERERQKGKEKEGGEVKRSWSGYETNSDLIWHVYDSVFFSFFPGIKMQAGIRLGGGLAWAQREERETQREMGAFCTVLLTERYSSVFLCVAAGWGGEVRVGHNQLHSDAPSSTWPESLTCCTH